MKKHYLMSVAVVALGMTSPALAAPPVYNWTGFYAGGNVGYSWGNADTSFTAPGLTGSFGLGTGGLPGSFPVSLHPDGFVGGVQAGYNWQVNTNLVWGVEFDFQGSDEKVHTSFSNAYGCNFEGCSLSQTRDAKINWFGTARGRIGWLLTPTTMLYGTGGLAYGKVSVSGTVTDDIKNTGASFAFSNSQVKAGFAIGAGIEGAVANWSGWTVKAEYLYIDLGSIGGSGIEPITGGRYNWDARFTDQIVRLGFNYRLP
jgi:outer membrane immunogenic protein